MLIVPTGLTRWGAGWSNYKKTAMRYLLSLSCLFVASILTAQSAPTGQDKLLEQQKLSDWEISLSFTPRFDREIVLPGASVEVAEGNVLSSDLPLLDTISVNGINRFFKRALPSAYFIEPSDANFWFGTQLRAHRALKKGFQLSAGLHYDRIEYTTRSGGTVLAGIVETTEESVLYPVAETMDQNIALLLHVDYHLRPDRRLHPYFGMGLSLLSRTRDRNVTGLVLVENTGAEIELPFDQFSERNSTLNLDFMFTAGLLYRLNDRWQLGGTINSFIGGAGIFGLQLRYTL